jgi:hypothetical protein
MVQLVPNDFTSYNFENKNEEREARILTPLQNCHIMNEICKWTQCKLTAEVVDLGNTQAVNAYLLEQKFFEGAIAALRFIQDLSMAEQKLAEEDVLPNLFNH